ncbi:MAG: prepilin-type N-terminal cleavage/methylation domain-containing protein [Planctomycetes bacterium]|nr:prepilin-type N-terminal cleavage/methylation domain-containing protein [Planctomycetota bacterium]
MRFRIKNRLRRAFTLIEILIVVVILGILAAIVIPQFTDASQQAMEASVVTQLQTIRSQIELHDVQWPMRSYKDFPPLLADFWNPLVIGDPLDADYNGNYLQSPPTNPLQNSDTVAAAPAADVGWVWADANGWGVGLYAVNELGAYLDIDGDGVAD